MKIRLISLLVIFVFLSVSCAKKTTAEEHLASRAARFGLAPDFKLQDLNQGTFSLASYRDKQPVILFFWTTWCPYCRAELAALNELYPQLAKDGWELFAIDVAEPDYRVENFVKRHALGFKVLLDRDAVVTESYGLFGVPTYVIVDKDGRIVFKDNYFPKKEYKKLIHSAALKSRPLG